MDSTMDQSTLPALLLACLTVEGSAEIDSVCAQLAPDEWEQLHELALVQRVSSLLWQRLVRHGRADLLPAATQQRMADHYYAMTVENLRLYHETGQILQQLHAHKIPVVVLKGVHLGAAVYPNPALRLMNDVDLLFAQADVPAVAALFEALGYTSDEPLLLERHFATDHHLPRLTKAGGTVGFEVHWRITYPEQGDTVVVAEFWPRTQPVTVAGVTVLAFCPEDLLLYICAHATYHHHLEQGIRFLCDIDAIARCDTVLDWVAVTERAKRWGWTKGVGLALTLAQQRLKTPIPDAVLRHLHADALDPAMLDQAMLDQAMLDQAIAQLFADQSESLTVSIEFAQMWAASSWRQKIQLVGARLFAPARIIQRYPVQPGSCKVYLYYPVRTKDLLVRYFQTLWRLWRGDPLLTATTQRKQQVAAWFKQR